MNLLDTHLRNTQ